MLPYRQDVAIDLVKLTERRDERNAAAAAPSSPEAGARDAFPTPVPGSRSAHAVDAKRKDAAGTDRVNALLSEGKEDEAIAAMENLVAHASGEYRAIYQEQLDRLRAGVARNKAVRAYNAAIAAYNRREFAAALEGFEKAAALSPDSDIGKAAREKATLARAQVKKN